MKKITLLSLLFAAVPTLADDTEIYGTSEIDASQRVNSNVMFIMDTSGSMGGSVAITHNTFNPASNYSGSYNTDEFYYSLGHSSWHGIKISTMEKSSSTNCTDDLATLRNEGRVLGNYQAYRWGRWQNLRAGSDYNTRCDRGSSYWLYSGNYMNWYHDPSNVSNSTRMDVVVDVVKQLTRSLSNINLGLMRFDQNSDGGMVDVPIGDVATTGALIRNELDSYYPKGGTPLEETMYEAARYYRGEDWIFGNNSEPNPSVTTSRIDPSSAAYASPVSATCQKNHIILLTDGEPTNDSNANSRIRSHINNLVLPEGLSKSCSGSGDCMDELAYWMRNTDQSSAFVGEQAITTYTIGGFDLANGVELLKRTAKWGGGQYYEANDTTGLATALESIFLDILATDSTFTAPAVSVNAFNASEHRDDLFYALFRPDDSAKWSGNLKKYRLTTDGFVFDSQDTPAISEATGFFNDAAKDFWNVSNVPDGKNVTLGGMANLIEPASRNIYSNTNGNNLVPFSSVVSADTLNMTTSTAEEVLRVTKWVIGFDVDDANGDGSTTDSRNSVGDPLHSEPVVVTYGGTEAAPDSTIYFGTNEGFIHGIDTESGTEEFAFIPQELHSTQKTFYDNTTAAGDRPYGMDGSITTWMKDVNKNNVIYDPSGNLESGEHVYMYAGMRRGGQNYYALDVTNRNNPSMLFKITGGSGDFQKLGQSWSKMTIAKVKYAGTSRVVAFFTGGYDTNQDGNTLPEADTIGNAIYMVDATTGERLWWSSNSGANLDISDMVNSIPASISAVDINGDDHVDYFFAADTGGRVFRIDINPSNTGANDFAKGGMIASLAGVDAENNRRFYNKPNVSIVKDKQYGDYLTIGIGSGHRAHPIFTTNVKNRFYLIKDFNPYTAPTSYGVKEEAAESKITLNQNENPDPLKLYNATSLMTDGDAAKTTDMQRLMSNGGGWYVTFANTGEKVLAESTTFAGAVIFTTFAPSGTTSSVCGPDTGTSRVYAIDQKWATARIDLDGDGDTDNDDASKILAHSGIAPRPVVIYREGGGKTIAIGTETVDDDRFQETNSEDDCQATGTCEDGSMSEKNNLYVQPQYWRQNDS